MGLERVNQFFALAYGIVIVCFRHSVYEDDGFLPSLRDLLPLVAIIIADSDQKSMFGFESKILSSFLGAVSVYLAVRLYRRHVAGRAPGGGDLRGKCAVVTGANTGLGFETAKELASRGAAVVLACRSREKAENAREKIINETKCSPNKVRVMLLDLADLNSVESFVKEFESSGLPLNVLINNAGMMTSVREESAHKGFELVFTANHLAHFHLTNLLLPLLQKNKGRVVVLTSSLHKMAKEFNFSDVMSEKYYSLFSTYAQSKLANMLFVTELNNRLRKSSSSVTVNAVHPGAVNTEVSRNMGGLMNTLESLAAPLLSLIRKTPTQGAASSIYAATSKELDGVSGKYIFHCKIEKPSAAAEDLEQAKKLWELSEKLVEEAKK